MSNDLNSINNNVTKKIGTHPNSTSNEITLSWEHVSGKGACLVVRVSTVVVARIYQNFTSA